MEYPTVNSVLKSIPHSEHKPPPLSPKKSQTEEIDILRHENKDGKNMEVVNQDPEFYPLQVIYTNCI